GRYTDDINLPNQAWCVMVRSQVAHGIIKGIDISEAKKMPGVLGVWTGADLEGYGTLKTLIPVNNRDGSPMKTPARPSLAIDKVRFVGDPVAFVVAETAAQAKDAAEAVQVDIDSLPAVTDSRAGAAPGAPLVFDDVTGNLCGSFGMKGSPFPEYAGLFHAAKLLGRPVKWTDDRSGSFLSDQHGRDHEFDAELALDKDGTFLAVRLTGYANVGAYLAN